jgi:hypothetical protein
LFVDSDSSWVCRAASWPVATVAYTVPTIAGDPCQGSGRIEKTPLSYAGEGALGYGAARLR